MADKEHFDFWYAVNNTDVLKMPSGRLETFGNTLVNYHLLTEMMDAVHKVRVREGRVEVFKPEIILPGSSSVGALEDFGPEAEKYMDWLRTHEQDIYVLKYGFSIRKQNTSENIVSESLEVVKDRVLGTLEARDNPFNAVLVGVEEPWEVCLLKLIVEMVHSSAPSHLTSLSHDPHGERNEVEKLFRAAVSDPSKVNELGVFLEKKGLFDEYQDRFFSLMRSRSI